MRLIVTLLSLTVTATALVALNGAMMGRVAEESSGGAIKWSRVQLADSLLMILLGVVAAALVWIQPGAAEVTLWAAMAAGLVGMAIEGGLLTAIYNENITPPIMAASVLLSGAAPAAAAASAALLTHRYVLPKLLAITL
jgi:hypothetical protein